MYVPHGAFATLSRQPFRDSKAAAVTQSTLDMRRQACASVEGNKRSMRVPINTRDILDDCDR